MVAAYADGRLEEKSQLQLETHFADCGHCLNELTVLVRAEESLKEFEVSAEVLARVRSLGGTKTRFGLKPAWGWAALSAATVLAVFIISLAIREPWKTPSPVIPATVTSEKEIPIQPSVLEQSTPASPPVRNGQKSNPLPELMSPSEGAVISRKELEFRWREVRGSIDYEILVVTGEGDVVWETRTESTHTRLPANISLIPQKKYFVWVRADLPEGRAEKSAVVSFRVGN